MLRNWYLGTDIISFAPGLKPSWSLPLTWFISLGWIPVTSVFLFYTSKSLFSCWTRLQALSGITYFFLNSVHQHTAKWFFPKWQLCQGGPFWMPRSQSQDRRVRMFKHSWGGGGGWGAERRLSAWLSLRGKVEWSSVSSRRKSELGAELKNNYSVSLSVFTCLLVTLCYRLHSVTQLWFLESSLAARVCIHMQPTFQKRECLHTGIRSCTMYLYMYHVTTLCISYDAMIF